MIQTLFTPSFLLAHYLTEDTNNALELIIVENIVAKSRTVVHGSGGLNLI